jgi:outer membrane lipoprotein-sorting protein
MKRLSLLVALGTLALVPSLAGAQDTPPPPAPDAIAPEVRALLEKSVKAYRALSGLQANVTVSTSGLEGTPRTMRGKLIVQRPSKVRFVTLEGTPKVTSVSNGQLFFQGVEGQPTYLKTKLPPGATLSQVMDQTGGLAYPLVNWMLSDPSPLQKIILPSFTSGKLLAPESLGGSVVDVIEFRAAQPGQPEGVARIAIDRADSLIHRISMERSDGSGAPAITQTELWSSVVVDPALTREAFAFYPAAGTKAMDPSAPKPAATVEPPTAPGPRPAAGIPSLPKGVKEITLEEGLKLVDLKVGTGKAAPKGATVTVHYTGWLPDGTKFDSSLDRGQPATFGLDQVVKGWGMGIPGMKIGGKRRLIIPPALGYGETGTPGGPIPPNATLIFDIELIGLR